MQQSDAKEQFIPANLEEVVGDRFGKYSKYIIQDRAIPDVRDGLKPVQRRIMYSMYESGNTSDKPYRKSAKTVGDVMGNFHPHGDSSIYEGMVRMAQPWKMAHTLIDGHGNWGSIDDDPPAAMRYTEARLSPLSLELLRDIDKRTVSFRENFDNTTQEPTVLPARYPNLLVNGASGISAGFATEIPPHNLGEVIDATLLLLKKPQTSLEELTKIVKGPDFPTGGILIGIDGAMDAYRTGKGKLTIRAKTEIESLKVGRQQLVIHEIPYQVVKSRLVQEIELIRYERRVEGIQEVRDESGRNGMRIVVEFKKDADVQHIFNYLLKKTNLQVTYSVNMVAIVNKAPRQIGLKIALEAYIEHQKDVVTKRTKYDLEKLLDRMHVLEGLAIALVNLDELIALIKSSKNRADAGERMMQRFGFTERQADAILTLQLYRLTNLEIVSIQKELDESQKRKAQLQSILDSDMKLIQVIGDELSAVRKSYAISRRTAIETVVEEIKIDKTKLIPAEDVYVSVSSSGYVKRSSLLSFQRSGATLKESGVREGDQIRSVWPMNTLDVLLVFTNRGNYFAVPIHSLPDAKWKEPGTPIVNLISLAKEERIVQYVPIRAIEVAEKQMQLMFITSGGQVKRTNIQEYETQRTNPIVAIKLSDTDQLVMVSPIRPLESSQQLLMVSSTGMVIRFAESEVSEMGRVAGGVRGIALKDQDTIIFADRIDGDEGELLFLTDEAFVKTSLLSDFPPQGRAGKGLVAMKWQVDLLSGSNGNRIVQAFFVKQPYNVQAISEKGAIVVFSTERAQIDPRVAPGQKLKDWPSKEKVIDAYRLMF